MKKKYIFIFICSLFLATSTLYSQRVTSGVKKYGELEGTQVELDLFLNLLVGGGSGQDVISIIAGGEAGFDLIFTLPQTKIYGISISPSFSYVPNVRNSFKELDLSGTTTTEEGTESGTSSSGEDDSETATIDIPTFSVMTKMEMGASIGIHISYFASVYIGLYYTMVGDFPIELNIADLVTTGNDYNAQNHFNIKVGANFNHFLGEERRFAFTYGFGFNFGINEFGPGTLTFDGRVTGGIKYRFYLGGKNSPKMRMQKTDIEQVNINNSSIWVPPINSY